VFDDWDNPDWQVWHDSLNVLTYYVNADVYLERPIPGIVTQSWLLLERIGDYQVYQITGASEQSIAGFGISAKAMALDLAKPDGTPLNSNLTDKDSSYKVRRTTGFVKSEQLQLAAVPVTSDLLAGDTELILNGLVPGLQIGQPVALTGEQADAVGVLRSEIKFLDTITHNGGFTALKFTEGLAFAYKRDMLIVNANVASATHGETQLDEVLGSGDGAQPNQRFKLKKPPLTYVSAATASGSESTLTVRVNGVAWQQTPTLYGLNAKARNYVVWISDGADAYVVFGDGKSGGRLPTGQENVTATYRSGIGLAGEVGAGSLTLGPEQMALVGFGRYAAPEYDLGVQQDVVIPRAIEPVPAEFQPEGDKTIMATLAAPSHGLLRIILRQADSLGIARRTTGGSPPDGLTLGRLLILRVEQDGRQVTVDIHYDKAIWSGLSWAVGEIPTGRLQPGRPVTIRCETREKADVSLSGEVYLARY
jgi:hypothetical protein